MKAKVFDLLRWVRLYVIFACGRNRLLGRLYYMVEPSFDREFEYTLRGRYEALSSRYKLDRSNANIRRCIHRLEKGLFHKFRRETFGRDVLEELHREVKALGRSSVTDVNELRWAIATLKMFRPHSHSAELVDECMSGLRAEYKSGPRESSNVGAVHLTPEFKAIADIYRKRESVRFYVNKPVEPALVAAAVNAAKEAPSACNRQPFHLKLLTEPRDISFIGQLAPGTAGFLDNIPMLGVLVGHCSAFRFSRDRHLVYIDGGLFMGHLLPALASLDLSTCVLNWTPDWRNDRKAIKYLGLDLSKTVVSLLAIGYRDSAPSPISLKKTGGNLLRVDE